jgi:putative phosphoesterase
MKIALIGDIHGNLHALQAVLQHARKRHVKAIWNVGDFIGYGAFPEEVIQLLREANALSIVGNYDLKALQVGTDKSKKPKMSGKQLAFRWAYEQLSEGSCDYLHSLPLERRFELNGWRILMTHGSPESNEEHLTPDTTDERLITLAEKGDAEVILCGHSHIPFTRQVNGYRYINPGSVGRPDDGDPRASYVILTVKQNDLKVQLFRLEYDVQAAADAIREKGLPEAFARMLEAGHKLEDVSKAKGKKEKAKKTPQKSKDSKGDRLKAKKREQDALMPEATEPPLQQPEPPILHSEIHIPYSESPALNAAVSLMERLTFEKEHVRQVTRLALILFDRLQSVHGYGEQERFQLQCGALLHDIGLIEGAEAHHKTALRIILKTPLLPLNSRERLIIGSIARYHRRATPKEKHDHYIALTPEDRERVQMLAGILRVTDALDYSHESLVQDIQAEIEGGAVHLIFIAKDKEDGEWKQVQRKSDLLQEILEGKLSMEWKVVHE